MTVITLLGTCAIDLGLPSGVAAWALYCLPIVLALQWKGAPAIVAVTAVAMISMLLKIWMSQGGDFETGIANRAFGAVAITGVALACLYIDSRRRRLRQTLDATSSSRRRLRLFFDNLDDAGVVLTDIRGRVMEWSHGAQQLTGYPPDQSIGRPFFRMLVRQRNPVVLWSHICRQARMKGKAVREEVYLCQNGSWRRMHTVIKPLRSRFGRLRGYSLVIRDSTNHEKADDALDKSSSSIS